MQRTVKYLSVSVIVGVLWLQTIQPLLAQDAQSPEENHGYTIYLPAMSSGGDGVSSRGELAREPTTTTDEEVASSIEELQRDPDPAATGTATDAAQAAAYALYWTRWVSEENGGPPTYCQTWDQGAVGFGCRGGFCDDVSLLCETFPYGITLDSNTHNWTSFFSEESDGTATHVFDSGGWYSTFEQNAKVCNAGSTGGVVQGIRCNGAWCDNISLECSVPVRWVNGVRDPATMTNCSWSGWYSEEQGSIDFGWNRYITGVRCSGAYCDNKQYYVCSLAP